MPRLGDSGGFPVRPGRPIYGPGPGFGPSSFFDDDEDFHPIRRGGPRPRPGQNRPPRPIMPPDEDRDQNLPLSYPNPPTQRPIPQNYPKPSEERRDHRQSVKFTPWILNLKSETHRCADLNLFSDPKPLPRSAEMRQGERVRPGTVAGELLPTQRNQKSRRRGTVVLPFLPGPKRRMPYMGVSVMTLSNVLFAPGAKYSEISWKLLAKQGFTRHVLHRDHTHDITHRNVAANDQQYRDGANRLKIGRGLLTMERDPPPPGLNRLGGPRSRGKEYDQCGKLDEEGSVIRHRDLPGIDLLWCNYDQDMNPGTISIAFTAASMVDLAAWSMGVQTGIVGKGARFNNYAGNGSGSEAGRASVGWIARYGGNAPDAEPGEEDMEGLFRKIVQGGLF